MKKKDFAKIPDYLQKVKDHLQKEYETVREIQKGEEEQKNREKFFLFFLLFQMKFLDIL